MVVLMEQQTQTVWQGTPRYLGILIMPMPHMLKVVLSALGQEMLPMLLVEQ
jgi:hypothetical protein